MSTLVISSLNSNMIGVVTSGNLVSVADTEDLKKKADKTTLTEISDELFGKIHHESQKRNDSIDTVNKRVGALYEELGHKADSNTVQEILSKLTLNILKSELDGLFAEQIALIHESSKDCVTVITTERELFDDVSHDLLTKLNIALAPIDQKLSMITKAVEEIPQLNTLISAAKRSINEIEAQYTVFKVQLERQNLLVKEVNQSKINLSLTNDLLIKANSLYNQLDNKVHIFDTKMLELNKLLDKTKQIHIEITSKRKPGWLEKLFGKR